MKCIHCGSQHTKFETIHTNLVKDDMYTYTRSDRETTETHSNKIHDLTEEYVIITINCDDCNKQTDISIKSIDGTVRLIND